MPPTSPTPTQASANSPLWRVGSVVGGRYDLRAQIGVGAMGVVWRADHLTLGTTVAVKLVDTEGRAGGAELLARFQQEARAAAQLKSPHVVQILDYGADGRIAFMAMELLEGESLEQRLDRRGNLSPSEVAHVLREMARGVDRAHAAGIVHRDLKPPNVFMARVEGGEVVKVLDFGIAKMLGVGRDAHLQTQAGFVVGTPSYMSPEQVLGQAVDHRSDLWQMAVIAFEALTGKRPFDGETLGQLFMAICTTPLPVPSAHGPVPPGFDAWFARACSRDPALRFGSAGELAEALGGILAPGGVGESAIPTVSTSANAAWSAARVEPPRRAAPMALLAGLLVAPLTALVVGSGWWWSTHRAAASPIPIASASPPAVTAPPATVPAPKPPAAPPSSTEVSPAAPAPRASASKPAPVNTRPQGHPGGAKAPVDLGI